MSEELLTWLIGALTVIAIILVLGLIVYALT